MPYIRLTELANRSIIISDSEFVLYKIDRENLKSKKILTVNEKYYVADHGLRAAVYGHGKNDIEQVLENIICLELLRRGYKVTAGRN